VYYHSKNSIKPLATRRSFLVTSLSLLVTSLQQLDYILFFLQLVVLIHSSKPLTLPVSKIFSVDNKPLKETIWSTHQDNTLLNTSSINIIMRHSIRCHLKFIVFYPFITFWLVSLFKSLLYFRAPYKYHIDPLLQHTVQGSIKSPQNPIFH
jgi:hypothetical protein